jgi:beta-lysine 5,6-aminomutase alpha subunit
MSNPTAEAISAGKLDITKLPVHPKADIDKALEPVINATIERVRANRLRREKYIATIG